MSPTQRVQQRARIVIALFPHRDRSRQHHLLETTFGDLAQSRLDLSTVIGVGSVRTRVVFERRAGFRDRRTRRIDQATIGKGALDFIEASAQFVANPLHAGFALDVIRGLDVILESDLIPEIDGSNEGAPTLPFGDRNHNLWQDQAPDRKIAPMLFSRRPVRKREASDEKRPRGGGRSVSEHVQAREELLGSFRSLRKSPLSLSLDRLCATESRDRAPLGWPLPVESVARF